MSSDHACKRIASVLFALSAWMAGAQALFADPPATTVGQGERLSLLKLSGLVSGHERPILSFRLEGVVRASSMRRGLIALDDGTSAELLELPSLPPGIVPGNRVVIEGADCLLARGPLAVQLGTAPVIDNDGHHPLLMRSGSVYLQEGMRELRLEWFNGHADGTLELEYEGADLPRQKVPPGVLRHREPDQGGFKPGLEYISYEEWAFHSVTDFSFLEPQARGIVPDFDVDVRSRPNMAGLLFSGFLQVPRTGTYTFYLTSDDGARMFLSNTPVTCRVVKEDPPVPEGVNPRERTAGGWGAMEGTVTYAALTNGSLELELAGNSNAFHATVVDGTGLDPMALLHKSVRISGLKKASGIVAIDAAQLQVAADGPDQNKVLTKAVEIRELHPDAAAKPYNTEIQGVVTIVSPRSLVVQDATGGVFVHYFSTEYENPPHPSELWKIEGYTSPGDFSPVMHVTRATCLGSAALPKAVQPTQQQLASGSLDAELVEIEGVVTGVSNTKLELLTRSGKVSVWDDSLYPLPTNRMSAAERGALVGSVVRLRGVCRANWDMITGNVQPSEMMLGNATMSVDEPASRDPYSAPLIRPSELLLFTSHPNALKRVKLRGKLLLARLPELFLCDETNGFRVMARDAPEMMPGDEIEASGFPQLGGPSPALLEAHTRITGHSPLPAPIEVASGNLPDARLDSTRVTVEASLLSDTVRLDERALEVRAGSNRFVAFLPSGKSMPGGIERDSVLKLTGVYVSATADRTLASSDPFELRLQGPGDIVVLKRGPWWTKRRTMAVIAILSAGLGLAFFWVTLLRRTVAKRSRDLAMEIEEREVAERHRAMEQERSRMAKDLHDELGAGLTEAGFLSSLMKNPAVPIEQKSGYLDQLNNLCCTLVTGLDEIVWAVNPRYDSVADLAGYFSLYAQRFLKLAGIDCRLKVDDAITKDPLDSRTRHEIFLAFKEALNNVVRHSGAGEVHLTLEVAAGHLMIFLADNGCGFDRAVVAPGCDGLHNMEERIRNLGGTCIIKTRPNGGTTTQFDISLK